MTEVLPAITATLAASYGLTVTGIERLRSTTTSVHARVDTSDGSVFVKTYPPAVDLGYELRNIELAASWTSANVPGAQPVADHDGQLLHTDGPVTLSVWRWVDGQISRPLTVQTATEAGTALARLHRHLDQLHLTGLPICEEYALTAPRSLIAGRHEQLLRQLAHRPDHLRQRKPVAEGLRMLKDLHAIRTVTAPVTWAPIHGDYAASNLLYTGTTLAAVLGPRVQLGDRARELGLLAFDPYTVATAADWAQVAQACIDAYLEYGGPLTTDQIAATARRALLHMLTSTHPLADILDGTTPPATTVQQLSDWDARCTAITKIARVLGELEFALVDLADPNAHCWLGLSPVPPRQVKP